MLDFQDALNQKVPAPSEKVLAQLGVAMGPGRAFAHVGPGPYGPEIY